MFFRPRHLAVSAFTLLLTGCVSSAGPFAPGSPAVGAGPSSTREAATRTNRTGSSPPQILYDVVSYGHPAGTDPGQISIFAQSGHHQHPIQQFEPGIYRSQELTTDSAGNLYVVSSGADAVQVFASEAESPFRTIRGEAHGAPYGVAVGADGTVYVTDPLDGGSGNVTVFTGGANMPSYVIADVANAAPYGVAVDGANNLYVAWATYPNGGLPGKGIYKYAPGATTGTNLGIATNLVPSMLFDSSGNLIALDNLGSGWEVDVYAPGQTTPASRLPLPSPFSGDALALNQAETSLYVTECEKPGDSYIVQYAYPSLVETNRIETYLRCAKGLATSPAPPL